MSPSSVDSWTLYSGDSPTSSTMGECSSSEEASSSSLSTFDLLTSATPKRLRSYHTETEVQLSVHLNKAQLVSKTADSAQQCFVNKFA